MHEELIKASFKQKTVITNLMQFYMYDFSEFVDIEVQEDGLFAAYKYLDEYWKDDTNRFPYIIHKDKKHVGFVLVRFIESAERKYFSIAEFFVMKKYRRVGIGRTTAHHIFDLHKGDWEVFQKESNKPAQLFWNKIINEYTKGNFTERLEDGRRIQNFIS
jgi:predicted acetyltransferase